MNIKITIPNPILFFGYFSIFTLCLNLNAYSKDIKPNLSKSKTSATTDCIDCSIGSSTFGIPNYGKLKNMIQDVAIFLDENGKDPRVALDRKKIPQLNSIGLLKITGKHLVPSCNIDKTPPPDEDSLSYGSGFLINECLVMTNHHVAFQKNETGKFIPNKIHFYSGQPDDPDDNFAFNSAGKVVAHGDHKCLQKDPSGKVAEKSKRYNDWAIIKLDHPVAPPNNPNHPRAKWHMKLNVTARHLELSVKEKSSAAFYLDDEKFHNESTLYGQESCELNGSGALNHSIEGVYASNCPAIPGASGAPVFSSLKDTNEPVAYGLITAVNSDNHFEKNYDFKDSSNQNLVIPFSKIFTQEQIDKIIKDNPCRVDKAI